MATGKINLHEADDKSGNRPHYKGCVEIDGEVHELALWPAKNGNGFSGTYKPKGHKVTSAVEYAGGNDDIAF